MNAQKFTKDNNLQNIKIRIGDKQESILLILERFQQPITDKIAILKNKIYSINKLMRTNPMSPMTEMEYIREKNKHIETIEMLEKL